jgi:hypothetical protein
MSLESKKLRLQPPVATPAGPRDPENGSQTRGRGDAETGREEDEVEVIEEN